MDPILLIMHNKKGCANIRKGGDTMKREMLMDETGRVFCEVCAEKYCADGGKEDVFVKKCDGGGLYLS